MLEKLFLVSQRNFQKLFTLRIVLSFLSCIANGEIQLCVSRMIKFYWNATIWQSLASANHRSSLHKSYVNSAVILVSKTNIYSLLLFTKSVWNPIKKPLTGGLMAIWQNSQKLFANFVIYIFVKLHRFLRHGAETYMSKCS